MSEGRMLVRRARDSDLAAVTRIYNQGILDRIATLEADPKDETELRASLAGRQERYAFVVAETEGEILGWGFAEAVLPPLCL